MKFKIFINSFSCAFYLTGCEEDDYELGPINSPSNLQVSVDIVGADDLNPYGDGSGVVNFAATASNASSYEFIINGESAGITNGGILQHFLHYLELTLMIL